MAWLVATDGKLSGRRYSLDAPCLVGRGPYNHVVLDDTRISRQHAKISPEAGGHVVYDLNSANGTYVNHMQVRRQKLAPSDQIRFGPFSFRFETELQEETRRVAAGGRQKFVEVATLVGTEARIVESLDAKAASKPGFSTGLDELEDAGRKLQALYAFMQSIASTLDPAGLYDRILAHVLNVFVGADNAVLYLPSSDSGKMEPRKLLGRSGASIAPYPIPDSFYDQLVVDRRALLSSPVTAISAAASRGDATPTGISMHAPMLSGDAVQGVLHVQAATTVDPAFTQGDLDLLTGIAAQAALALQNVRLHQESLKQQRLKQDLSLAVEIQKSFLPQSLPVVQGLEFIAEYRPAFSVGGDFYDLFSLAEHELGICIGDVSGKGVSAALLMARVCSDIHAAALLEREPARTLWRANRMLCERRKTDLFVTAIYLALNTETHDIVLGNAGHLPPLIRRSSGKIDRVEGGASTAIGLFENAEYEQIRLRLEPGDSLVLCTDGVLEATSERGEQFGFERLEASILAGGARPQELVKRLNEDLSRHVGAAPQYDDMTLIVCGRQAT